VISCILGIAYRGQELPWKHQGFVKLDDRNIDNSVVHIALLGHSWNNNLCVLPFAQILGKWVFGTVWPFGNVSWTLCIPVVILIEYEGVPALSRRDQRNEKSAVKRSLLTWTSRRLSFSMAKQQKLLKLLPPWSHSSNFSCCSYSNSIKPVLFKKAAQSHWNTSPGQTHHPPSLTSTFYGSVSISLFEWLWPVSHHLNWIRSSRIQVHSNKLPCSLLLMLILF